MPQLPKRSDERTRRNKTNDAGLELKKGIAFGYKKWPEADKDWHPRVKEWFASLGRSGMANFYEESDIMTAKVIADGLNEWYNSTRRSSMQFDAVLKHMASLGVTEGERRKMRIELDLPEIPEESEGGKALRKMREELVNQPANVTPLFGNKESAAS